MNENLDLTKILEGCPKGTEFYHMGYGRVQLVYIDLVSKYPIRLSLHNDSFFNITLTSKGTLSTDYDGECLLLPSKDQRDWSKFERFWDKSKVEKFDLNTLQPFDKVLIRNYDGCIWDPSFFGYKTDEGLICIAALNAQCIPYNEETKHLIGTKEDCPEYYKWWEE